MYHCHFEDVEHVQMGMTGIVFVRPVQDGTTSAGSPSSPTTTATAPPATTGTSRSCSTRSGRSSTTTTGTSRRPSRPTGTRTGSSSTAAPIRRRCCRTTRRHDALGHHDRRTRRCGTADLSQPNSSLIQADPASGCSCGWRTSGTPSTRWNCPASRCTSSGRTRRCCATAAVDTSYWTNTLYLGPGEARDVLIEPPRLQPRARPGGTDNGNPYNVYYFRNQDWRKLSNGGAPGLGGMMTELRVYRDALPAQTFVSQVFDV